MSADGLGAAIIAARPAVVAALAARFRDLDLAEDVSDADFQRYAG